ncbi:hypothetical protein O7623_18845 [Solwaraspora sp. WMMD791]|uniref:hypothetical protein n=1 Tax=Solwaraspora sp. WMMD791 TaxID=3016086 RepID=UPI00249A3BDF|nr:hypothetical protein [Solwaraspora sp. WMMD791]WFE25444.1 hypothetical protein O7623_18845 [Solwaraspora sp. WMMD791]
MGTSSNNPGDEIRDPGLPTPAPGPVDEAPLPEVTPDSVTVDPNYSISYEPGPLPEETETTGQADDADRTTTYAGFSVSLAGLAATEGSLLTATRELTAAYEQLRTRVASTQGTVFGQTETHDEIVQDNPGAPHQQYYIKRDVPDALQAEARVFAGQIQPYMAQALDDFAKTLQLFGAYIQALEATGDGYATADDHSRFDSG